MSHMRRTGKRKQYAEGKRKMNKSNLTYKKSRKLVKQHKRKIASTKPKSLKINF